EAEAEAADQAWGSPEEAAQELSDLRCMRRQIRYLFGGGVTDRSDHAADAPSLQEFLKGSGAEAPNPLSIPGFPIPQPPPRAARQPARPPGLQGRGRTMSSTASSNTDVAFSRAGAEEEHQGPRRDERRDRKHRKHRRQDGSAEPRADRGEPHAQRHQPGPPAAALPR
ncbi:unnamed protein product, partial [Prorocentrum cordatum]